MEKHLLNVLSIAFTAASGYTPAKGDKVELTAAWECNKPSGVSSKMLGTVDAIDSKQTKNVTVATRFTRLTLATAGAAISAVGPIVLTASQKYIPYSSPTHTAEQIAGLAVETAAGDGSTFHALLFA